jgi:prepilin-type N-terminal cleavage/methylation domain-containing protein
MTARGFTLVELLIVVAIVGVLAVVAGTAYRKYMDANRTAEVMAMLGELRVKEEAYRAENNSYLSTTTVGETDYYPVLLATGLEPKAKTIAPLPASWTALGVNPTRSQLYCGYVVVAGAPNTWGLAGAEGKKLLDPSGAGATVPTALWWYARATCDNDGNATVNATWITGSSTTSVTAANEHK